MGPIGSGKTSVIQAGVIPRLRQGSLLLPRSFTWEILTVTPGEHPTAQLTAILGIQDEKDLADGIKSWKRKHSEKERLVLIIDQFEELFTLAQPEERNHVIAQLLKIIIHDLATVILIMNDLYYDSLAEHKDFIEQAEHCISNVPQVSKDEVTEIISQPAKAAHLYFEGNLVGRIADDTMKFTRVLEKQHRKRSSSTLPQLSFSLEQLATRQRDNYVTIEDYETIGGISGSLALWASRAFDQLNDEQQTLAHRIFIDLVELGDDNEGRFDRLRKRLLTHLCYTGDERPAVQEVVEKLARAHLLEIQRLETQNDYEVQIVHIALLRDWDLLKQWLREDHHFLVWYQIFERRLQEWLDSHPESAQRDAAYLLRGRPLTEAQQWLEERSPQFCPEAQDFVRASATLQEQEALQKRSIQEAQSRHQIAVAGHLATKALSLQKDPRFLRQSLLLAIEALRRHHHVEADTTIRTALALLPRHHYHNKMMTGRILLFSGNGQCLAAAGTKGVSWIYNVGTSEHKGETFFLGNISAIALSYNGEYLVAGVSTGVAWVIQTIKRHKVAMIKLDQPIHCVTMTQRAPYCAVIGCEDGNIYLYAIGESDEPIIRLIPGVRKYNASPLHIVSHGAPVLTVAYSDNESYLVSGGTDHMARVWRSENGMCIDEEDFFSPIHSTVFSPDSSMIAVVNDEGKAFLWKWGQKRSRLWNRRTDAAIRIPLKKKILSVAFSPDGLHLATTSEDGLTRIWSLEEMLEVQQYNHDGPVSTSNFHQTADWIVTASTNGIAKVYNTIHDQHVHTIPHTNSLLAIALNPHKPYLATAENNERVWIWELHNGNYSTNFHHAGNIVHFAFDSDGDEQVLRLATEEDNNAIKIWTISPEYPLEQVYEFERAPGWSLSNDGRRLALPQEDITTCLFSADGNYVVVITFNNTIRMYKISTSKLVSSLPKPYTAVLTTFSQDGAYIAFVDIQDQLYIWKWREGKQAITSLGIAKEASKLAFSSDDEYLIMMNNTKSVFVWEWRSPAREARHILLHETVVQSIALCSDTPLLLTVSQDKQAHIWDLRTGLLIHYLTRPGEILFGIFDGEGNYIATANSDQTVSIWNVASGEELASLPHDAIVCALAFSRDGRFLATADQNAIVRMWIWKPQDLEAEARVRLQGNLTPEEWEKYFGNEPYQETLPDLGWRDIPPHASFDEE